MREIAGYPEQPEANRRAFERDKEILRGMGVPITMETIGDSTEVGYRVRPDDYCLPDLGLSTDETAALRVAVSAISLGDHTGEGALMKLGGVGDQASAPIASLPIAPALATLFDAFRRRAVVNFTYRGETRTLEPWGLSSKRGHWYVVGFDRVRDAVRAFRADRIDGDVEVAEADAFEVPADFRADDHIEDRAWMIGDAPAGHGAARGRRRPPRRRARRARLGGTRRTGADRGRRHGRGGDGHEPGRVPQSRARLPRARGDPRTARRARRHGRVARGRRGRCRREPQGGRRRGGAADPRDRAVDRRASRRVEARDREPVRHDGRAARRRPRARADDRRAAVLARRLPRRRTTTASSSRSVSPTSSRVRCGSRPPKVSPSSPPGARSSPYPGAIPRARWPPRSRSSSARSISPGWP